MRTLRFVLLVAGALVLLVVLGGTFFGDNVRALLGASADSLSGGQERTVASAPAYARKSLGRFARNAGPAPAREAPSDGTVGRVEDYGVNGFEDPAEDPFSTFAVDVDSASYTLARRAILAGRLPPPAAVRVEEFLNYFRFDYPAPEDGPFAVHLDAAPSPFAEGRTLLRVGLEAREVSEGERKPAHLVFLVDVSGSMQSEDRLPLAKRALRLLVDRLGPDDTVALVTYASSTRVVLEPTGMDRKAEIHDAIESLTAGGSTAMSSGLELAYRLAARGLGPGVVSRVLVLSDGDANVGPTGHESMLEMIHGAVEEGVTLTTVGFGLGNYNDRDMERLADEGNGQSLYVDSLLEARRAFVEQLGGTLEVVAKDVKLQVEFDPRQVRRYRLLGYENRAIADRDFRNDRVDAGELGSGHNVTALYEVELREDRPAGALATVRVRAKAPRGETAREWVFPFESRHLAARFEDASDDLRFAAAVAGAAERLRGSAFATGWDLGQIEDLACGSAGQDPSRREFCSLLGRARDLEAL